MTKLLKSILIATASVAAISAASAADLPTRKGPPIVPIIALYSWSGFYAGVNLGYGFGSGDRVGLGGANFGTLRSSGVLGGVQVGYNWQTSNLVLGIEGDIQLSGVSDTVTVGGLTTRASHNYFGTIRGRLGFAVNRALFYVTGGGAFTDIDYRMTGLDTLNTSYTNFSWTAGGGVEYAFNGPWSAKLEYLYVDAGRRRLTTVGALTTNATQSFHVVRLGLNYRW